MVKAAVPVPGAPQQVAASVMCGERQSTELVGETPLGGVRSGEGRQRNASRICIHDIIIHILCILIQESNFFSTRL